jgi:hypothetical protein
LRNDGDREGATSQVCYNRIGVSEPNIQDYVTLKKEQVRIVPSNPMGFP